MTLPGPLAAKTRVGFHHFRLDPAVDLVVEEHPSFHSVAVGFTFATGSRAEHRKQEFGISHFLEHMLFKGTEKRSAKQIVEALEGKGGELNAYTDREVTCYHSLTLKDHVDLAIDVLSDMVLGSTFPEEEIKREKSVVLQELAMSEDSPDEWAFDTFYEKCWLDKRLAHGILGTSQSVRALTRQRCRTWHQKVVENAPLVISVAGPVEAKAIRNAVQKTFCDRLKQKKLKRKTTPASYWGKPRPFQRGKFFVHRPFEQSHILLGFPGLPYAHPHRCALFLMNMFLGGGMSSTLFQSVREKLGLAYNVYSSVASLSDTGVFAIYVGTTPSAVPRVLKAVAEEVRAFRSRKLDASDLALVKEKLVGSILLQADSMESRMQSLALNHLIFGRYVSVDEVVNEIKAVTSDRLYAVAQELLDLDQSCLLVVGPKGSKKVSSPW